MHKFVYIFVDICIYLFVCKYIFPINILYCVYDTVIDLNCNSGMSTPIDYIAQDKLYILHFPSMNFV